MLNKYAKGIIAGIMAGLISAGTFWPDNRWVSVGIAVAGAVMVYAVPNKSE